VVNTNLALAFSYNALAVPVEDMYYTIEADYGSGSSQNSITFNDVTYNLIQFHFHEPSEHTITGFDPAPMEVHLIHQAVDKNGITDPNGAKLVIGVLINVGEANTGFGAVMTALKEHNSPMQTIDANQMIPSATSQNFFTYTGSLTTPPCTPGITWVVMATPITISQAQLDSYKYPNSSRLLQATIGGINLQSNSNCQYCCPSVN